MTCQQIVTKLLFYRMQLLRVINLQEQTALDVGVTSQYAFIAVKINELHFRFELSDVAGKVVDVYCKDEVRRKNLVEKMEGINWPGWQSHETTDTKFSEQVSESINTADSIANLARYCTHGDDYHPGNFSKVAIKSDCIELEQINYMNSKSLAHKEDYSLRKLTFIIPLGIAPPKPQRFEQHQIGIMQIEFSDHSSAKNKRCGDKILAELKRLTSTS